MLQDYVQHLSNCPKYDVRASEGDKCTCGLDAVMEAYRNHPTNSIQLDENPYCGWCGKFKKTPGNGSIGPLCECPEPHPLPESVEDHPVKIEGEKDELSKVCDTLEGMFESLHKSKPHPTSQEVEKEDHPEDYCHKCGGKNPVWSAENKLFNEVNGSPNGIMCPSCFIQMANDKNIPFTIASQPPQPWRGEETKDFYCGEYEGGGTMCDEQCGSCADKT